MIDHTENEIRYATQHLEWLRQGKPEGKEPWRGWQWRKEYMNSNWEALTCPPIWSKEFKYREKPAQVDIPLFGLINLPFQEKPQKRQKYFIVGSTEHIYEYMWRDDNADERYFSKGLLWKTKEDAIAWLSVQRTLLFGVHNKTPERKQRAWFFNVYPGSKGDYLGNPFESLEQAKTNEGRHSKGIIRLVEDLNFKGE